ncbi:hypothetical protein [Wolbachia endosymbiont of Mansonella ozzardi]|uniref:hypothetical protein n=1 Tax=Wolbachia endosymbiont of Mansonella ozzardi TaxID=137464 RepID=UPI001CE204D5|nr:hypothetical protein [Wolbachia endosymbiont of Mansonella ozzardi]
MLCKGEYLGFINEINCKRKSEISKMLDWKNRNVRLLINKQSKQGFYLDQGKIPILVESRINKFGYLELVYKNTDQVVISFQKN